MDFYFHQSCSRNFAICQSDIVLPRVEFNFLIIVKNNISSDNFCSYFYRIQRNIAYVHFYIWQLKHCIPTYLYATFEDCQLRFLRSVFEFSSLPSQYDSRTEFSKCIITSPARVCFMETCIFTFSSSILLSVLLDCSG